MPGVTKRIYEHEIRDIVSMWDNQLKSIQTLLPKNYGHSDIIELLKKFYPHDWRSVEIKYLYYQRKDRYLKKRFNKARYNMKEPEKLLYSSRVYRKFMSDDIRNQYADSYSEKQATVATELLWDKRKTRIDRINRKIEQSLSKTQQVTPEFIAQLIGFYERKSTSQKDRMYILLEIKKYYSSEIMQFFFKLNDTELNKQLRQIAFEHLQSFDYRPRARRQKYMQVHTKNKKRKEYLKKIYPDEQYKIPKNPNELEYRIENSKEQKIKTYDFFISHSCRDSDVVQALIRHENQQGKNVFCDWISDSDYLKRHLLCDATLKVLEKRLLQSKALIFVDSGNSRQSVWCKYELNYFRNLKKLLFVIDVKDILNGEFSVQPFTDEWYMDSHYKEMALLEGRNILV